MSSCGKKVYTRLQNSGDTYPHIIDTRLASAAVLAGSPHYQVFHPQYLQSFFTAIFQANNRYGP